MHAHSSRIVALGTIITVHRSSGATAGFSNGDWCAMGCLFLDVEKYGLLGSSKKENLVSFVQYEDVVGLPKGLNHGPFSSASTCIGSLQVATTSCLPEADHHQRSHSIPPLGQLCFSENKSIHFPPKRKVSSIPISIVRSQ